MNETGIGAAGESDEIPLSADSASAPSVSDPAVSNPSLPNQYVLRLYVTGKAPNSLRAISRVREVCEEFLLGRYQLQVVDMYQQPALAGDDRIMVTPTLVRRSPGPLRRLIGNLSDRDRILAGLELRPAVGVP
jgi:circadian clock protein KaiB